MQDLSSAVQSGYFFGPFSPHNWGKDLPSLMRGWDVEAGLTAASVTTLAFAAAASAHAPFWQKHDELAHLPWLKTVHTDRDLWIKSQQQADAAWQEERAKAVGCIEWHPQLVACLEASLSRARAACGGWEAFQAELKTRPLTLVHGDFHPGNMMIAREGGDCSLFLLDWEVVGVGSGPQELGQYVYRRVLCVCHREYVTLGQVPHIACVASNARRLLAARCGGVLPPPCISQSQRGSQHEPRRLRGGVRERRRRPLVLVPAYFGGDVPPEDDAVLSRSSAGVCEVS